jgi:hypothetical protein
LIVFDQPQLVATALDNLDAQSALGEHGVAGDQHAGQVHLAGARVLVPHFMGKSHAELSVDRHFVEVGEAGAVVFELLAVYDGAVPQRVLIVAERVLDRDFSIVTVYHDLS